MKQDPQEDFHGKRVVFRRKGEVGIEDFGLSQPDDHEVVIKTVSTLVSAGTETAF